MPEETIRILIVDDHAVVRRGLSAILETEPDLEVVGEAENGNQAVWKTRSLQPDVILMDLVMPEKDGIEAIKEIKKDDAKANILVITSFAEDEKVFPAIKAGALGYLLKDSSPDDLIQAIHEIHQGKASLHPTIARKLIMEIKEDGPKTKPSEQVLTTREVEVLTLIARGLSNQQIANQLMVGETTVRFHVSNILSKLHLANRTQAVLYALKEGIAKLEDL